MIVLLTRVLDKEWALSRIFSSDFEKFFLACRTHGYRLRKNFQIRKKISLEIATFLIQNFRLLWGISLFLLSGCGGPREVPLTYVERPTLKPFQYEEKIYPPSIDRSRYSILIDPGHGGNDEGTKSLSNPRYHEKFLTLMTGKWLRDYLTQMGYTVQLTRTDDRYLPLLDRSAMANEAQVNLFVSVHFNSAPSREAQGIEVFYYKPEKEGSRSKASKELAARVLDKAINATYAKSRGVKHGNYSVIRETAMPAILIEGGFLTNVQEMEKIKDPNYLKRLAWGIAQGVDQYLLSKK